MGGRVGVATASTIGLDVEQRLSNFVAHQPFVRAHAFDVADRSHDVARTKRDLVRPPRCVTLLAGSSKRGIEASAKAFAVSDVDVVVSDAGLPDAVRAGAAGVVIA